MIIKTKSLIIISNFVGGGGVVIVAVYLTTFSQHVFDHNDIFIVVFAVVAAVDVVLFLLLPYFEAGRPGSL